MHLWQDKIFDTPGMKILMIANPNAGKNKSPHFFDNILEVFHNAGQTVTTKMTESRNHAAEIAERMAPDADMIVCFGGDGTLNEVINGIMRTNARPLLGYIPAGTTNDFAQSMQISKNPVKAARAIGKGRPRFFDLGYFADSRYFTYVASFGAFTRVSYSTPQKTKNRIGHLAYVFEGIRSLSNPDEFKPKRMKIIANGTEYEDEFIFGAVTNSTSIGGLVKLDRKTVNMNDGLFEVMLIRNPQNFSSLCNIAHDVLQCRYNGKDVVFFQTNSITFLGGENVPWSLDGEYHGGLPKIKIEVVHNALKIIV